MRKLAFIPLLLFVVLALLFAVKITERATHPDEPFFESLAMLAKPLPQFTLPAADGGELTSRDFQGQYTLINIFASWCAACRVEHPLLSAIKERGIVRLYGIAWRDRPQDTQQWLERFGNPYDRVGMDESGEVVISLGITGAPESFLVDPQGIIRYHHVGVLDEDAFKNNIIPLLQ